jgi:hypothetical protein
MQLRRPHSKEHRAFEHERVPVPRRGQPHEQAFEREARQHVREVLSALLRDLEQTVANRCGDVF